jgi:integrase
MTRHIHRLRAPKGSGTAYQRSDGLWVAERTIDGQRIRRTATTESLARARLIRAIGPARGPVADAYLRDFLPAWAARQTDRKAKIRAGYAQIVRDHLVPSLGEYRLSEIRAAHVRELMADMGAMGLSAGTRRNVKNVLSGALKEALADDLIPSNPARAVSVPAANSRSRVQVSQRDAQKMLDAMMPSPHSDLLRLLLYQGLRYGEAVGLDWADITLAQPATMHIHQAWGHVAAPDGALIQGFGPPKSRAATRVIPIVDEARTMLWSRYHKMGDAKRGLVFPSSRNPLRPVPNTTALKSFHQATDRAHLPRMRLHDLRHWCATILLGRGVPVPTVAAILGHASPNVTLEIYAGVFSDLEHNQASAAMTFFPPRTKGPKGDDTPHPGGLSDRPHQPA